MLQFILSTSSCICPPSRAAPLLLPFVHISALFCLTLHFPFIAVSFLRILWISILRLCLHFRILMLAHIRSTWLVVEKWKIGHVWCKSDTWSNSYKTQVLLNLLTFPLWSEIATVACTISRKQAKIPEKGTKL